MKLFENKVGRPTNEIKNKRRVFIFSVISAVILFIIVLSCCLYTMLKNVNPNSLSGKADNFITFAQGDSRWGNKIFCGAKGDDGLPKQTFRGNACGATAMAMAIKNLTGEKVTPETIAKEAQKAKYCHTKKTKYSIYPDSMVKLAEKHNLYSIRLGDNKSGLKKAKEALKNGGYVLAFVNSKSGYTSGLHWLVFYSINNSDTVSIANPIRGRKQKDNINNFVNNGWLKDGGWIIVSKKTPDLKCKYKSPSTGKIKERTNGKTLAIIENDKFTCTAAKKATITPASGCSLVSGSKYTCSKDSKIVAKLGNVTEKVVINTVKSSNKTTTTKKKTPATTTTTSKKPNVTTTTTKLVGNNKCKVLQITPGSNSVNITPVCGKNAKLIRVNIYKESKAVISRKNVKSADTVLFNKLSKGKYYVGLVYKAKKVKHSASLRMFEITDGETYSVYRYNLDTNTELCGVENSKIINGKVTYSVKCGSNAKLTGAVLYDETNHKSIVMSTKKNNDYGFNKELTYQNNEIKTTNNYHIRLYWTTNNNSGTGVSVFARSTSTIK